jgi:hypothetical protein
VLLYAGLQELTLLTVLRRVTAGHILHARHVPDDVMGVLTVPQVAMMCIAVLYTEEPVLAMATECLVAAPQLTF